MDGFSLECSGEELEVDGTLEGFLGDDRLDDLLCDGASPAEAALLRDRGKVADMAVLATGTALGWYKWCSSTVGFRDYATMSQKISTL